VVNVPSPAPSSTVTVPSNMLATAMSGIPSPLTSAIARELGPVPVRIDATVGVNVASPFPKSTVTEFAALVRNREVCHAVTVEVAYRDSYWI
jgi:hypothetical protein